MTDEILARPGQTLVEHIKNVTDYASKFGEKIDVKQLARIVGLFHDVGKNTKDFQAYIRDKNAKRGSGPPHSNLGSKYVYDKFSNDSLRLSEILSNIIMGHHGTLYDNVTYDGQSELLKKLEGVKNIEINNLDLDFEVDIEKAMLEVSKFKDSFDVSMLIKYVYSCLIDGDRLDAYLSSVSKDVYTETKGEWDIYLKKLIDYLNSKEKDSMSDIRQSISDQCAEAGAKKTKGTFKLEVATGGGKTLSSLRFACEHAKAHGMDRVIYVIPYLSIIDQTEKELKELLGEEAVLAHHSGVLYEKEDHEDGKMYKLHTDRWDKPIIITTMVQFLETAFSSRASKLRKFHNMANSVIIFDEIQSLPIKCMHLFNGLGNFLTNHCGSTLLLCSATQPLLDTLERPIKISSNESIVSEKVPARIEIVNEIKPAGYTSDEVATFAIEKFDMSMLLVFNTKRTALEVYQEIKKLVDGENKPITLVHLSTNMCSVHRKDKLDLIKKCLGFDEKDKKYKKELRKPIICVSTQLIEAGVDVSFKCVIRALAGLDNIYQAAGRCNRHGEYNKIMPVYVINMKDESLSKLPDIKLGAETTRRIFDEKTTDINQYYRYYLNEQKAKMDYPSKNTSIYSLLTSNASGCDNYIQNGNTAKLALRHAIKTASDEFNVIEKGGISVVVHYKKSVELLKEYDQLHEHEVKRKVQILKELGQYSVGLYQHQIEKLEHVLSGAETGVLRLAESHYHDEFGVYENSQLELLMY